MSTLKFLDILGFVVGLVYLWLEYKVSIWLWLASIIMPAIDMVLYYKAGLYADFGMAIYYCLAAVYGWLIWRYKEKKHEKNRCHSEKNKEPHGISHFPIKLIIPASAIFIAIWFVIYWFLSRHTNSTVPVTDAFTTALSIIALWALAQKYAEQWLMWLVVDAICCGLYIYKGIPFKAAIYGIYTGFAVFGYLKWRKIMTAQP